MISNIKNINIVSSFHTQTKKYGKIESRKYHGFLFKITGLTDYFFNGKKITLSAGNVLFIPQGASYEYVSQSGDSLYTSINFFADVESPCPTLFSTSNFYKINFIYNDFSELWRFGATHDKYTCMSVFYDFLSYLARITHLNNLKENNTLIIEPAIEYLKSHIFKCNLKIENLSKLCCISDTYFRKLFILRFNVTPQEYVISKRLAYAKSIIESGDFNNISEIAELVGYKDPFYFSKAFKKFYGVSPSNVKP